MMTQCDGYIVIWLSAITKLKQLLYYWQLSLLLCAYAVHYNHVWLIAQISKIVAVHEDMHEHAFTPAVRKKQHSEGLLWSES